VGSVIVSRDWTMNAPGGASYSCTAGTNRFAAKIVATGSTDLGNKVYSTNVPGIGMRLAAAARRSISSIPTFSPPPSTGPPTTRWKVPALRWRLLKRGDDRQRYAGGGEIYLL
jgi:hypothetical protein